MMGKHGFSENQNRETAVLVAKTLLFAMDDVRELGMKDFKILISLGLRELLQNYDIKMEELVEPREPGSE